MSPARVETDSESLPDDSKWVTQADAARRLNCSMRSIHNYVTEGKLATRLRSMPGRKPLVLIAAGDVEKLSAEQNKGVLISPSPSALALQAAPQLAAALVAGVRDAVRPPSMPRAFLTVPEAAEYCGLPPGLLYRLIRQGRLAAEKFDGKRWVKRRDVDSIEFEVSENASEPLRDGIK